MSGPDPVVVCPGDVWAGVVRAGTREPTVIEIEKVCSWRDGCPSSYLGAHAHAVTLPGRIRSRTILLNRFRGDGKRTVSIDRIRAFGGTGGYSLVSRPDEDQS